MPAARARWLLASRCIAAALLLESASSFQQRVCVVRDDTTHRNAAQPNVAHARAALASRQQPFVAPGGAVLRCGSTSWFPVPAVGHRPVRRARLPHLVALSAAPPATEDLEVEAEGVQQLPAAAAVGVVIEAKAAEGQTSAPGTAKPPHHGGDFLFEQKLESVKAALLCGGVGAAGRLVAVGAGAVAPPFLRDVLAAPEPGAAAVLFGVASGFAQGALFGLTYRYVVRADRQAPKADVTTAQMDGFTVGHLGDGCVAAFALTSALGQSEVPLTIAASEFVGVLSRGGGVFEALVAVLLPVVPFLPRAAADLVFYSVARAALDRALDEGVIKPFP